MNDGGYCVVYQDTATLIRLSGTLYENIVGLDILYLTHTYAITLIRFCCYFRRIKLVNIKWGFYRCFRFSLFERSERTKSCGFAEFCTEQFSLNNLTK